MRRQLVLAVVALTSLSCASGATLHDAGGGQYDATGHELCDYDTFALGAVQTYGTVSARWARQTFSRHIAERTRLRLVQNDLPDLVLYVVITDATECIHCPEDHNYWQWSVAISDRTTDKFLLTVSGSGNKLWTSPGKATAQQLLNLRRCAKRGPPSPAGDEAAGPPPPQSTHEPSLTRHE